MNCVLSHSLCLMQNEKSKKEAYEILFKSILHNEDYWEYSKNPEFFENIFKNVKK